MENTPNPLAQHYENTRKLDYFILTADIAILGWIIANTDWIPKNNFFLFFVGIALISIAISILFGIYRQLHLSIAFGLNYTSLYHGELANIIERSTINEGIFKDQATGEEITSDDFKKFAPSHRKTEKEAQDLYKKQGDKSTIFGNLAMIFLIVGIFLLSIIKIISIYQANIVIK